MASQPVFAPPSAATLGRRFIGTPSVLFAMAGVMLFYAGLSDLYKEADPTFEWGGMHLFLAVFAVLGVRQLLAGRWWLATPALVGAVAGVGALRGLSPIPDWRTTVVPFQISLVCFLGFAVVLTVLALWQRRDAALVQPAR